MRAENVAGVEPWRIVALPVIGAEIGDRDHAAPAEASLAGSAAFDNLSDNLAASAATRRDTHYDGNYLIVAAGVALAPDYEGSPRRSPTPAAGVMGRIGPVSFSPRAAGIAFNLLPLHAGKHVAFSAGPVLRHQSNRHGSLSDPAVAALGELPGTWELGINSSVAYHGLLTPADALSLGLDVRWDVSGHGAGRIVTTSLGYYSPVSRGVLLGASAFADFADDRYARYNYGISPAGSRASGLPAYVAHGGNKAIGAQGVVVVDLDGDLLDRGFAALAGVSWSRLQGSAAETPITALRGQRSQVTYAGGIGYSF